MKKIFWFIFIPIILTTSGEFFLKHHINGLVAQNISVLGIAPFLHIDLLIPLLAIVTGGILWVVAMSKFELSFLYPFLTLNYLAIIIGSQVFLGESVSLYRYISIVLIIVGLIFISRSPNAESK